MAKSKSAVSSRKTTFGRRKGGKAVKSYNKHNSKSTYHKQQARRQK